MAKDEPQSYGSQQEWVTGDTGQQVNRQKSGPAPESADFYAERRESESSAPHQGGEISDSQLAESRGPARHSTPTGDMAAKKVTDVEGGAIRDSYFKGRDYPD